MKQIIFVTVTVTLFAAFSFSSAQAPFELIVGNCTNATIGDLLYQHYVERWALPLVDREDVIDWFGDEKIYCLRVTSGQHEHQNSSVEVLKGGVGHTFVQIRLHSDVGYGYEYYIMIFGRKCDRYDVNELY